MKYLDMTDVEFRLIREQAAQCWALNAVRAVRPGATTAEERRYGIEAARWQGVLRKLGVTVPDMNRAAFIKPGRWGEDVFDHTAAGAERRRLIRIICETKSSPRRMHSPDATQKRTAL